MVTIIDGKLWQEIAGTDVRKLQRARLIRHFSGA